MNDYGVLSIVPPALSIFLAIYTRNIVFSLTLGAICGSLIITDFNPFLAVPDLVENHLFIQISSGSNTQVIMVMFAIGGFIQLLHKSGGAQAFSTTIIRVIFNPIRAQFAAWMTGIGVFFTDSGNAIIVGPLYKPVFRRLNICREKLAFIIDTTAGPGSVLIPFVGWGVYVMSLIENSYNSVGIEADPFDVLLNVWPYQFYAFFALLSIPMILSTGRDFGPMARAQARYNKAVLEGTVEDDEEEVIDNDEKPIVATVAVPLGLMVGTIICYLTYFTITEGVKSIHVRGGIFTSYIFASLACAYLMRKYKGTKYTESLDHFVRGMQKLVFICMVLALAWSLSSICAEIGTGNYLASVLGERIKPEFFPLIVFFLGAITSFATGSSYGTFAILMIIVIPVAHALDAPLVLTIAAVTSGGLFGDHTSPISDTTLLASMGSGCTHIDHVSTQFTYALLTGLMTILAFTLAAIHQTPLITVGVLLLQFFIIFTVMKFYGKDANG